MFAALANCLRVTDPERAESMLAELDTRARREQALRGRLAGFFLRRSRELSGLREAGKFAGLYALRDRRRRLLLIGAQLHTQGLFTAADDVMFLDLPELRTVVETGADLRATIASRRAEYERELRRRTVPVALLSDGTDVETLLPAPPSDGRTLTGMGAASGRVTGRARVVRDPSDAASNPGTSSSPPRPTRAGPRCSSPPAASSRRPAR